jgi:hypothetical protein
VVIISAVIGHGPPWVITHSVWKRVPPFNNISIAVVTQEHHSNQYTAMIGIDSSLEESDLVTTLGQNAAYAIGPERRPTPDPRTGP